MKRCRDFHNREGDLRRLGVGCEIPRHHMTSCDQERDREAVLARLFPKRGEPGSLDKLVHDAVLAGISGNEESREALCRRIREFFARRGVSLPDSQVRRTDAVYFVRAKT